MPHEAKWWSTQNSAYLSTSPSQQDFSVIKNISVSSANGFSLPSSRVSYAPLSSKSAKTTQRPTCRSIGIQTDATAVPSNGLQDDSISLASSNCIIDSYSVPNLHGGGSGVLSSNAGSMYFDNFDGGSVDRGFGGSVLKRQGVQKRSYDVKRKKKITKKIVLPRLNHMAAPSDPETDFAISGRHLLQKTN